MTDEKGIKELNELSNSIEKIEENPIIKPLIDFNEAVKSLQRDDEEESYYLREKEKALNLFIDKGVYESSMIAQRYEAVLEIYKRLLLIFKKYSEIADKTIVRVKKDTAEYYVTKKYFNECMNELREENRELREHKLKQEIIEEKEEVEEEIDEEAEEEIKPLAWKIPKKKK